MKYAWLASTPLPWDHCGDHYGRHHGDHYFVEIIVEISICILSSRPSICQTTRWVEVIGSKIAVKTSSRAKTGAENENQAARVLTNPTEKIATISEICMTGTDSIALRSLWTSSWTSLFCGDHCGNRYLHLIKQTKHLPNNPLKW